MAVNNGVVLKKDLTVVETRFGVINIFHKILYLDVTNVCIKGYIDLSILF